MAILASLTVVNLFSNLPSTTPPNEALSSTSSAPPPPPILIPKYPPPKPKIPPPAAAPPNPAIKTFHRRTKYIKPIKEGVISSDGDRSVVIGDSGVSYLLPGAPFEFQYSYSETPKVKPLAIREPAFLPFASPTMARPWTGKAPLKSSKKKIPLFDSFNPPPPGSKGVKHVEMPGPFPFGKYPKEGKNREEILGEPLKKWEIQMLIKPVLSDNRQVNLGRDGLTHNMLELIHFHWKRRRVCKIKCKGVPTVDMRNICRCIEEKTGGKIIYQTGGVLYIFRGRNYNYRTRPQYPVMLWKPAAPVYPKLIQDTPEGLTKGEADELRIKGKKLLPICKLAKNGVYISLVSDVRHAFEGSSLVKIDCTGMHKTDYRKLGAKLKELVPCALLSFDDEQILMWRGRDWKSTFPQPTPPSILPKAVIPDLVDETDGTKEDNSNTDGTNIAFPYKSLKMLSLWKRAINSNRALLLEERLGPNELLAKVEEFEGVSQATEHSHPVQVLSSWDNTSSSMLEFNIDHDKGDDWVDEEDDIYSSDENEEDGSDQFVKGDSSPIPIGSLPIDRIAKKLGLHLKLTSKNIVD